MSKIDQLLDSSDTIVLDGAMGTLLMEAGLKSGVPPEEWNTLHAERIQAVHQHYVDAGSQVILTNSFGGTRFRLMLHNLEDRVYELNKAAAENARLVADRAPAPVLVAGSMGPTGELMAPIGTMTFDDAKQAFADQARALIDGGVDLLWVETMSDLEEVRAAVEGARTVSADVPIAATMSFDTKGRTMMGITPSMAVKTMSAWDLAAIGANCGNGIEEIEQVIYEMHQAAPDVRLIAKANAGIPHWHGDVMTYDATPSVMGTYAQRVQALGACFIGGCCGNSPDHIGSIAVAVGQPLAKEQAAAVTAEFAAAPESASVDIRARRSRRPRS